MNFAPSTAATSSARKYLPATLTIRGWHDVEEFFTDLQERGLNSADELWQWLKDKSELEACLQEDLGWRYIKMSCDTANEEFQKSFNFFIGEIQPKIAPVSNELDKKLLACPFLTKINSNGFELYIKQVRSRINIYRDENVPLIAELQQKEQEYSAITGAMTVEVDGKEITLQQASNFLMGHDRLKREAVYRKITTRRLQDRERLDLLFDELIKLRHQVALNAGFANYRDYMFVALNRFDYTPDDCFAFHQSITKEVVPICEKIDERHKEELKLESYRPWDTEAEPEGQIPLRPYSSAAELVEKTILCFEKLDPFLASCIEQLDKEKRFDLESRIGKAPGGYNYPLYESGLPFIFMNSTNTLRDLVTMVHEGGHAVHSIVTQNLPLTDYKSCPSEVAELASMSMELMSMEHWNIFFTNTNDLNRARKQHLEKVLDALPWIAAVDKFQHWVYTNYNHTADERRKAWRIIYKEFSGNIINWDGLDDALDNMWQRQLHIFEVPFYYIEYGMAQLGAIAIWKNFNLDKQKAISNYLEALSLGYTQSISNIYKTAGVEFNFGDEYIHSLSDFVAQQLNELR